MKDHRIAHIRRGEELAGLGYRRVAEGLGLDEWVVKSRRHIIKPGTIWLWATQEAWEPRQQNKLPENVNERPYQDK